jgi:hypothetical protein
METLSKLMITYRTFLITVKAKELEALERKKVYRGKLVCNIISFFKESKLLHQPCLVVSETLKTLLGINNNPVKSLSLSLQVGG